MWHLTRWQHPLINYLSQAHFKSIFNNWNLKQLLFRIFFGSTLFEYVYSKNLISILFQGICMVCLIKIIQLPLSLLESLQLLVLFSCVWSIGWKPQQQTLAALSMSVLKSLTKMNWNVATPHHQWFRVWLQQQLCQSKVIYCLNLNLF